MTKTWRLFTGIPLTDSFLEALKRHLAPWPHHGLRLISPANWHVTTLFLGAVPAGQVDVLKTAIGRSLEGQPAFTLRQGKFILMPSERPRMLWVQFGPEKPFAGLVERLTEGLQAFYAPSGNHRDPLPHITLSRFKGRVPRHLPEPDTPLPDLPARTVTLWRSELRPSGAVYTALESWPLDGEPGVS